MNSVQYAYQMVPCLCLSHLSVLVNMLHVVGVVFVILLLKLFIIIKID